MSTDDDLENFLIDLSNDIHSKKLKESQMRSIGEFYMSYKMLYNDTKNPDEFSKKNIEKYCFLGYYVYNVMSKMK